MRALETIHRAFSRCSRKSVRCCRRSEESHALQQFSTPLEFAYVASLAARIAPSELTLEPSAGTGMLAIFAELSGATLILNEWAQTRGQLLERLFPPAALSRFDGAQINDRLDANILPSVVLMNPPFSTSPLIEGRHATTTFEHIRSALLRLRVDGRLVAITGESFAPTTNAWRGSFERLQEYGRLIFTASLARGFFARHGTTVESRLTIFDRTPAKNSKVFPAGFWPVGSLEELLALVLREVPPRAALSVSSAQSTAFAASSTSPLPFSAVKRPASVQTGASESGAARAAVPTSAPAGNIPATATVEVAYEARDWKAPDGGALSAGLYDRYSVQSIAINGARPHPATLVQSAAMASVSPLAKSVIESGLLSDAQPESVIYAGEAHSDHLASAFLVNESLDTVSAAPDDADKAVRFRRGYYLGDGAGAGKGALDLEIR
jgi:hypothetical protein